MKGAGNACTGDTISADFNWEKPGNGYKHRFNRMRELWSKSLKSERLLRSHFLDFVSRRPEAVSPMSCVTRVS